jgi:predicted transcriptional regulator
MTAKKLRLDDKKTFLQLRAQGKLLREIAHELGFSVATMQKLEKRRKNGDLPMEILAAENPDRLKDVDQLAYVLDLLTQCEQEISTRDVALLTTPKLIGTYRHYTEIALKLKKSLGMNNSTASSEPDDLDEIWSQVARAEGPK